MSADTSQKLRTSELQEIVESVFETMLSLQVVEHAAPWCADASRITSTVHLSGACNLAVVFECNPQQACRFAARFLSMDPPPAVDDEVRDVLGELANMIGGNVKGSLSGEIKLSMPSVVDGGDHNMRICGSVIAERLAMECEDGVFWVTKYAIGP